MTKTEPIDTGLESTASRLVVESTYLDPITGALYIHEDLLQVRGDWENEAHVGPFKTAERFGDVESWSAFVLRFGVGEPPLLTWSELGLRAVLDFGTMDAPGRRQAIAEHPFAQTVQWRRWTELANGRARGQQELLEALEDYAEDVVEPSAGEIATLLRTMRGTVNSSATSTLNEDGSYAVEWQKSSTVRAGKDGRATLPNEIRVAVPVFKGHTEAGPDGKLAPVRFALKVRIRVNPDSDGRLLFRLSMPDREVALEAALANRVQAAHDALGAGYDVLRATS